MDRWCVADSKSLRLPRENVDIVAAVSSRARSIQVEGVVAGNLEAIDGQGAIALIRDPKTMHGGAADDLRAKWQREVVGSPHLLGDRNGRGAPICRDGMECVRARGGSTCAGNQNRVY